MARFWLYLDLLSPHQLKKRKKKEKSRRKTVRVGAPLTKCSGFAHANTDRLFFLFKMWACRLDVMLKGLYSSCPVSTSHGL